MGVKKQGNTYWHFGCLDGDTAYDFEDVVVMVLIMELGAGTMKFVVGVIALIT